MAKSHQHAGFNPFKTFRKHQKKALVILGVGAIVLFTIPTALFYGGGGGGRGASQVTTIVSTQKYGDITGAKLSVLKQRRNRLARFFSLLFQEVAGPESTVEQQDRENVQQRLDAAIQTHCNTADREVVRQWLLVNKAEELGMEVTTDEVNGYLGSLLQGTLTNEQVKKVMLDMKLTQGELYGVLLHDAILTGRMAELSRSFTGARSPGEQWDAFKQLEQYATVEVATLPVSDFVSLVEDPSDAIIKEFFNENKNKPYNPNSPEAGFRLPTRLEVEYVKVPADLIDPASIPMEEVREYYENNKSRFTTSDLGMPEPTEETTPETGTPETTTPEADAPVVTPETPATPEEAPVDTTEEATTEAPAAPEATETPAEETPAEDSPVEEAPAPADSSSDVTESPFRLVSYQEETTEEPATEAAPTDSAPTNEETAVATDEPAQESAMRTKPFEEVEQEIREDILLPLKRQEVLLRIRDAMQTYSDGRFLADETEPPYDLKALAASEKCEYGKTQLQTREEMAQDSALKDVSAPGQYYMPIPFADVVFSDPVEYKPMIGFDESEDVYLAWIVQRAPATTPELDDEGVKERAISQWKFQEARKLAKQRADELAAKAEKAGDKPLSETLAGEAGVTVEKSGSFARYGLFPSQFRPDGTRSPAQAYPLRRIPKALPEDDATAMTAPREPLVAAASTDLMDAVFKLAPGGLGTGMNESQRDVYVVQLVELSPGQDFLEATFRTMSSDQREAVADICGRNSGDAWIKNLEEEAGLEWVVDPSELQ